MVDLQTISLIISIGAIIGTGVLTFFANKKSISEKVLRQTVEDYKTRIEQLEEENGRKDTKIKDQGDRIKSLENEKRLPLEELTALIVSNQTQTIALLNTLIELISNTSASKPKVTRKKKS